MDVEVAHVADDDQVDTAEAPRTGNQTDPGGCKPDGEQRHEPRPAQHSHARGGIEP